MKGRAIQLLTQREHSREELRRKLAKPSCDGEELVRVLDECASAGWQNDKRYAEVYARQRSERGFGPLYIRRELLQRGLAADVVETTLAAIKETWAVQINCVIRKRCRAGIPTDAKQLASLMRFLAGRGYTTEQINLALTNRDAN